MMRSFGHIVLVLASALLFSACGADPKGSDTTKVIIAVAGDEAVALKAAADWDAAFKAARPDIARTGISRKAAMASARFTISGSGMDTIMRLVSLTTLTSVTEVFEVPNGAGRTFLVEALDAVGNILYRGSTTTDLDGSARSLAIDLLYTAFSGVKQFGTSGADGSCGVAANGTGMVYVAGSTYGGLDGNVNSDPTGTTTTDVFIRKYDDKGNLFWTRQFGTATGDIAFGVTADPAGNVYVTGGTAGQLGTDPSAGGVDIFLVKFDASGNKLWTRQFGTSSHDFSSSVAVDAGRGAVYVAGHTGGDIGGTSAGSYDMFVMKFTIADGAQVWTRQLGSAGNDFASALTLDGNGNVYITGGTSGGLDGNVNADPNSIMANTQDVFLTNFDSAGVKQWTQQFGSIGDDHGYGVVVDSAGAIAITGSTTDALGGSANADPAGFTADVFIARYDVNGTGLWTMTQFGSEYDDVASGIALDAVNNVYVTGQTYGNFGGNSNAGVTGQTSDLFLVKYSAADLKNQWARQSGSAFNDAGTGVAYDGGGNIFLSGTTGGAVSGNVNAGWNDALLMVFDELGTQL